MAGNLIQIAFGHKRRFGSYISPLVIFKILDPPLQSLHHFSSLGHQKRQTLADHVNRSEKFHFTAQLIMVSVFDIIQIFQILGQLFLLVKSGSVNSLQHCIFRFSAPVSAGRRSQLKRLNSFRTH